MTTQVVRGSLWSMSGQVAVLGASLIATPFIIRLLSPDGYGVLALINVLIGYLSFADLGMGAASTKFASEAHARNDDEREITIVWTALLIVLAPALLGTLGLILAARPLVEQVLRPPVVLEAASILALRIAAVAIFARCLAGVLNTPQLSRLRIDLTTGITAGCNVAQICLVPVVLALGGGLVSTAVVIAGAAVLAMLLHALASRRLLPHLFHPRLARELMPPMMHFGVPLVLSAFAVTLIANGEKLLLGCFSSVTAVAHYTVAHALACMLIVIPMASSQPLMPAFSQMRMNADPLPLTRLYNSALKVNLLCLPPVVLLAFTGANPFLTFWAGPEFGRESTLPFMILVAGFAVNTMAYTPHSLIMAVGRSGLLARFFAAELLVFLLVAGVLCHWFGALGAAIACSVRAGADAVFMCVAAVRVSGIRFSPLGECGKEYLSAILPLVLAAGFLLLYSASTSITLGVVSSSLFAYTIRVWRRVLTEEERTWAVSRFPTAIV